MSMIICPECGETISQYTEFCVKCGFPIKKFMNENGLIDTSKILLCPKCGEQYGGFENIKNPIYIKCKYCNTIVIQTDITWDEFYDKYGYRNEIEFTNKYGNNHFSQEAFDHRIAMIAKEKRYDIEQNQSQQLNTPHCPTCNSTNIHKISVTSKALNAGLFGLLGNKRKKQFHCDNCGYEW